MHFSTDFEVCIAFNKTCFALLVFNRVRVLAQNFPDCYREQKTHTPSMPTFSLVRPGQDGIFHHGPLETCPQEGLEGQ